MKRILCLTLIAMLAACQESADHSGSDTSTESSVSANKEEQNFFYKRLDGTIAGQPVVMVLTKNEDGISGTYYYKKVGEFIHLEGTADGEEIILKEPAGEGYAEIRLSFTGDKAMGTWTSEDNKKKYDVNLEEKYPDGAVAFNYKVIKDSAVAYQDMKESPECTISIGYLVPRQANKLVVSAIEDLMIDYDAAKSGSPDASARNIIKKYLEEYKEVTSERDSMDVDRDAPSNGWESQQSMGAPYNENGYLVLESNYYDYSGGAHPNHGTRFISLDLKNNKKLKLSDIINADSATIEPIMEEYFRKGNENITPGQSLSEVLFENYLMPNDNFYINNKGIGFWYNPYEIAAYVYGDTEIFIPFERLKAYLTPEFKQRMGL